MPVYAGMTALRFVQVLTLVALALALVPAAAHLFEMPAKLALPPEIYMQVQTIYAGWALFGIPIYLSMILLLALCWLHRDAVGPLLLTVLALALMVATQAIFWTYTQPMNVLTKSWTMPPPNLAAARTQWEYSHAVNAVLTFLAFVAAALAIVRSGSRRF